MGTATQAAITGVPRKEYIGTQKAYRRLITMSSSYATNGDTLELKTQLGVNRVLQVVFESDDGYILFYDRANGKVKAFYADYDAVADGPLIEVANADDLSGVAHRATIYAV